MVKRACKDENGIIKGEWSRDEDNKLKLHIQKQGFGNWRSLPELAGLARCGKSCRLRWVNYLKPGVRKGKFTKAEGELINQLYQQLGPRWSEMARRMPGRTDNAIKNHWHAHIKKRKNSNVAVDDARRPQDLSGSSTTHDNVELACDDNDANSRESYSKIELTCLDDGYLSDLLDMENEQYYPRAPYISQDLSLPQLQNNEVLSSTSLNTLKSFPDGDHSDMSADSESLLLQLEKFSINEPAQFFWNC